MLDRLLDALGAYGNGGAKIRAWSVFVTESTRLGLGTKDMQSGNAHTPLNLTVSCGARYLFVWDDGLVSRGYFERRQIEKDIDDALAQSRLAAYEDPDAATVLGPAEMPEVRLHDTEISAMTRGEIGRIAGRQKEIRDLVRSRRFRTWSGSIGVSEGRSRLVTSEGLDAVGAGTGHSWHVMFHGELGDGFSARSLEDDEAFRARLLRLAEMVELLGQPAEAMPPGTHPVLLHPNVVESYVLGTLLENLGGAKIAHGEGQFRREQFDRSEQVLREDITLRLDPLEPLKAGSYRFTGEGVPASPCTYIEHGRLRRPILDVKYANRLGMAPTPVPIALDTLHLEGTGTLSEPDAYRAAAGGALVLSVLGVHTQDSASGDFSLSAPQTLRIGKRGPDGRMRGTLSGNLFEILRSEELRLVHYPGEHTPGMLVRCRFDPN